MKKKALITGIAGQDGSYLSEFLLDLGYDVYGVIRKRVGSVAINDLGNLEPVISKLKLFECSVDNRSGMVNIIKMVKPDECYHFAASSFVSYSFDDEHSMISTNFNSTHYILSAIKEFAPNCRFYFAASSELFGNANCSPQNEETKFNPRSIYGISKLASFFVVKNYREQHGLYACSGISYNHESPRRGTIFVTRKISMSVAKIICGKIDCIELGNVGAIRDWGYAPEYVVAMWKMLNNPNGPKDYIISTGKGYSVRDFLEIAFSVVGLNYIKYLKINKNFFRPSESVALIGNCKKIEKELGWKAKKTLEDIIKEMVERDIWRECEKSVSKKTKNCDFDAASK